MLTLFLRPSFLIKKITQTAVINIVFQVIFFTELDVSYASQHTFQAALAQSDHSSATTDHEKTTGHNIKWAHLTF